MSGRGMSVKFNLLQKGERKTIYDRKSTKRNGVYQELDDHKTMNSHSFALFQKEQFALRKKDRKKRIRLWLLVVVLTVVIVMLFLYGYRIAELDLWNSIEFQQ